MKTSIVYLIVMWLWYFGAMVWVYSALMSEKPRYLIVAGIYGLVMIMYGGLSLYYNHLGQ